MSLIHGQPITSEQVEHVTSREFTPQQFAALCNAVAWATAGRRSPALPSFTERTNAKDHGIDAEWQIQMPDEADTIPAGIFGAGRLFVLADLALRRNGFADRIDGCLFAALS